MAERATLAALVLALVLGAGCPRRATLSAPLDLDTEAPSVVPPSGPFVEALPRAAQAPDPEALLALCTPAFREDPDGCEGLWRQVQAKGFALRPTDRQVVERGDLGRLVLTLDVVRGERVVDRIFAYAIADAEGWRLGGVDEIREHAAPFLEFLIGPQVDVAALPPDPALDAIGNALLTAAVTLDTQPERIASGARDVVVALAALQNPRFAGSHVHEPLGRAALEFHADDEPVFGVYLRYREGAWRIVDRGYGYLSARAFLRAR
ncbi:MAG: hypothetical protein H6744_13285 [Deltaproteobacteria bacterium]|nr:hypothetical protein [Deltaproteobacteria bacterium]